MIHFQFQKIGFSYKPRLIYQQEVAKNPEAEAQKIEAKAEQMPDKFKNPDSRQAAYRERMNAREGRNNVYQGQEDLQNLAGNERGVKIERKNVIPGNQDAVDFFMNAKNEKTPDFEKKFEAAAKKTAEQNPGAILNPRFFPKLEGKPYCDEVLQITEKTALKTDPRIILCYSDKFSPKAVAEAAKKDPYGAKRYAA